MKTVLYYSPGACSLAPHILLEETGMDYDLVEVNVQKGKTQEKAFLDVNPKGRVPVLQRGDERITEVPAISWYIASSGAAAHALIPGTLLEQARALEWFNWLSGTLHAVAFGAKWRPQRFTADPASHDKIIARADANLKDGFAYIERRLVGKTWVLGDRYSIVDPYLFVFYCWARTLGFDMPADYPQWHAHAARIGARPAVVRALQQEGI